MSDFRTVATIPSHLFHTWEVMSVSLDVRVDDRIAGIVLCRRTKSGDNAEYVVATWAGDPNSWHNGRYFTNPDIASAYYANAIKDAAMGIKVDMS